MLYKYTYDDCRMNCLQKMVGVGWTSLDTLLRVGRHTGTIYGRAVLRKVLKFLDVW